MRRVLFVEADMGASIGTSIIAYLASIISVVLFGLTGFVSSHPGHYVNAEAAERATFLQNAHLLTQSSIAES
ncbi:hypothetical protein N7522_002916 [Penicillium canescens]|nr:hypothetical protein N7522_002916 [Penicillium canescens]